MNTRLISSSVISDTLEPLTINFPGFGSNAFLMTSPSTQLLQFLIESYVPSAFSVTKSFSSSYRFPNGSTELNVIVGKTILYNEKILKNLFQDILKRFLKDFLLNDFQIIEIKAKWPDNSVLDKIVDNQIGILSYECDFPIVSENWESQGISIVQIIGVSHVLYAEAFIEKISESDTQITTFTFYPEQILSLIQKSPRRHLQNLMRIYE